MNCKFCGVSISDDARFCTVCGKKVEAEEANKPLTEENTAAEAAAVSRPSDISHAEESSDVITSAEITTEAASETSEEKAEIASEKKIETNTEEMNASSSDESSDLSDNALSNESVQEADGFSAEMPVSDESFSQEVVMSVDEAPKKLTAGRAVGGAVLAFFAVIFLIIFNIVLSARIGLSSDVLGKSVSSVKAGTLLDTELKDGQTAAEYIYENLDGPFITKSNAQVKDVRSFLINSNLVDFASETVEAYAAYLVNGTEKNNPSIGSVEIADFLKDNDDVIYSEFGYRMTDADYVDVEESLADEGLDEALSIDEWSNKIGFKLGNLHFVFSAVTIAIIFALALVFFIWTAIVLDRHTKNIMGYFRTITLIGGLAVFLPSAAFLIYAPFAVLNGGPAAAYLAFRLLTPLAVIGGCTGLFELVVSFIFGKIRNLFKKRA